MEVRNWKMALTISNSSLDLETTEVSTSQTFLLTFAKVLKGDKGDKGDTGQTGPQGAKGDKGDTGEKGERGHPLMISTSINANGHLIVSQNNDGTATFAITNKHLMIIL